MKKVLVLGIIGSVIGIFATLWIGDLNYCVNQCVGEPCYFCVQVIPPEILMLFQILGFVAPIIILGLIGYLIDKKK